MPFKVSSMVLVSLARLVAFVGPSSPVALVAMKASGSGHAQRGDCKTYEANECIEKRSALMKAPLCGWKGKGRGPCERVMCSRNR